MRLSLSRAVRHIETQQAIFQLPLLYYAQAYQVQAWLLQQVCWLLRLSVRTMTSTLYLEHSLAYKGSLATSVHLYFKLPGGDKWKCTHL